MKKSIISTITAAAILASASTFAYAAAGDNEKRGGKHRGPNIERMLEKLDVNNDGGITLDEIKTHQENIFTSLDADSDNSLTQEEFEMIKEMRKAEREANKPADASANDQTAQNGDQDGKKRGKRGGKRGGNRGGPNFDRLDADTSGTVSLTEFTAHADKMFDRMDRNEDGVINADDTKRKRS